MSARTLILIRDKDNPDRVELAEFEDGHEAERYLEQLIADGVPQDAVRAFNAVELDMKVSHRPVVSLNGSGTARSESPREEMAAAANSQLQDGSLVSPDAPAAAVVETDENGQPFVRDGVRFSSLFKPDGGLEPA